MNTELLCCEEDDQQNGIVVHEWDTGHQVKWEIATIKEVKTNHTNRRIRKMV